MYLYYFNQDKINPLKVLIVRILTDEEYDLLLNSSTQVFELLIENNLAKKEDILLFSLIKENKKSIENIILPFTEDNLFYADKCEKDAGYLNELLINLLNSENCKVFFELDNNNLKFSEINYDLSFLINKYL
jgi:hypothetical protein